jgi:dipeptidyl aminopeptidase/acylaminoacyl peptidase
MTTPATVTDAATLDADAAMLADRLVSAWGSWAPTLSPDADQMAFISDRTGSPEIYVQSFTGTDNQAHRIELSADPVIAVSWSADGAWLAASLATGGGVRTQIWVVRPDGSDARRIAGSEQVHAELGPWTRSGHRVSICIPSDGGGTDAFLADPATGDLSPLASGDLIHVLDMTVDEQLVILRDGQRSKQFCVVVDRVANSDHPLLPYPAIGDTSRAIIRPAPDGRGPLIAYLATDAALPRKQCVALPLGAGGWRGQSGVLAPRDDAELEALDADDAGHQLLLVWNVTGGRSEVELYDTRTDTSRTVPGLPGHVVTGALLSRDGTRVVVAVEGPDRPREVWTLEIASGTWSPATAGPGELPAGLVTPELVTLTAQDGLQLSGWLYRVPGRDTPGPAMLSLHGGPEAQERPAFSAQHQAMVAAGIAVFAPNIRGSSGFGRSFVRADDVHGRRDAFDDVIACATYLTDSGIADPRRIAVTGRSYGGYLTLAALAFTPGIFAAGVDICGMSDLLTFYRDTEPWIAAAAVSKYGDPRRDRTLLRAISPLRFAVNINVPLLVVHGELDTNVPIGEARQIVDALTALDRPVDYLQLDGEGHEYRRAESRLLLIRTMLEFLTRSLGS